MRRRSRAIKVHFLPAGRGQSILVELPGNRWMVIDADLLPVLGRRRPGSESHRLPALQILEKAADDPGFEVVAIVVSHLHLDHYRGLTPILDFCRDRDQDPVVVLPGAHADCSEAARQLGKGVKYGFLEKVLERVAAVSEDRRGRIRALEFAWTENGKASLAKAEAWVFCFHSDDDGFRDFLKWVMGQPAQRSQPTAIRKFFETNANRYSCLLGVGLGTDPRGLHVLLTADVPGAAFAAVTNGLRMVHLPRLAAKKATAAYCLGEVVDDAAGENRVRRVSALSVPHHGSGRDALRLEDLRWWLGDPGKRGGARPVAVILGSASAPRQNAIDVLWEAGLRVFASSRPTHASADQLWEPVQLAKRLLGSPAVDGGSAAEDGDPEWGCVVVEGGADWVGEPKPDRFFELTRSTAGSRPS
jgi:hypothetical protein